MKIFKIWKFSRPLLNCNNFHGEKKNTVLGSPLLKMRNHQATHTGNARKKSQGGEVFFLHTFQLKLAQKKSQPGFFLFLQRRSNRCSPPSPQSNRCPPTPLRKINFLMNSRLLRWVNSHFYVFGVRGTPIILKSFLGFPYKILKKVGICFPPRWVFGSAANRLRVGAT